jgi:hypothetical protein
MVTAIATMLLWRGSGPKPINDQTDTGIKTNESAAPELVRDGLVNQPAPLADTGAAEQTSQAAKVRSAAASMNVPINFWGIVQDQENRPLSGVNVVITTRKWRGINSNVRGFFEEHSLTTGDDGRFEIRHASGDVLSVKSVTKQGYVLSPKARKSYGYNISTNFIADSGTPAVFRMSREVPAEFLLTGSKFYGVVPDGRIYTIDFLTGTKREGVMEDGDVRISMSRPETVGRSEKFDWSFTVVPIAGGILLSEDEFMNLAPETGYERAYELKSGKDAASWRDEIVKNFFVKTRNGTVFSRLKIEAMANYNGKGVFNLEYFVNTNGSRNLSYSSTAQGRGKQFE